MVTAGPFTNPANHHVYYLLEADTWTNCELAAIRLQGHLVTINDAAEDVWVFSMFGPLRNGYNGIWIGLTDVTIEGIYVWISGEYSAYKNWGAAEPNNLGEEDYGCYFANGPYAGSWNDCGVWHGALPAIVEVAPRLGPHVSIQVATVQIRWDSLPNKLYQLQYSSSATTNTWVNWGPQIIGNGEPVQILDSALHNPRRFYRVVESDP